MFSVSVSTRDSRSVKTRCKIHKRLNIRRRISLDRKCLKRNDAGDDGEVWDVIVLRTKSYSGDAVSVSIDKLKRISKWVRLPLNTVLSINIAGVEDRAELSGIVGVIRTLAMQRYST